MTTLATLPDPTRNENGHTMQSILPLRGTGRGSISPHDRVRRRGRGARLRGRGAAAAHVAAGRDPRHRVPRAAAGSAAAHPQHAFGAHHRCRRARYLEDARRILLEADEADEGAAGINATPCGHLAVTAPALFGKMYVMPVITAYQSTFDQTTVSALFVDRLVNLIDEGLDVGIRIGALPDSSLRAIRVGQARRVVCASPAYLEQHGAPQVPVRFASDRQGK